MPRNQSLEKTKHKVGNKTLTFIRDLGHQNYGQGAKQSAQARAKDLRHMGMRAFTKKISDGHGGHAYLVYKRRK